MMKNLCIYLVDTKIYFSILVDVKSNSFHIYNLLTFPPEVPFRGIFLPAAKSKTGF